MCITATWKHAGKNKEVHAAQGLLELIKTWAAVYAQSELVT